MNIKKLQFVVAGVLVLVSGAALAQQGGVKLSTKQGGGSYLSDADGKALYWYQKDSAGKSACEGPCLEKWQVYYHESVTPPPGMDAKDFGVITRPDGRKQTTFRGSPLYYSSDMKPGNVVEGAGSEWSVIDPAAFRGKAMTPGADANKGTTQGTGAIPGTDPHKSTAPSVAPTKTTY